MSRPSLSLNQSSAHPSLLNRRADMLSRKGIPQESGGAPWVGSGDWTRYGAAEVDLFATSSRMHIACCSSPLSHSPLKGWLKGDALTSHWPAARLYIKNKIKRCFGDTHHPRTGRTSFGSRTGQSCWWHRPGRSPSGRICYLRWAARGGTRTRSCGAFMCGCFGDIRGAECPAFSCARHALGWCGHPLRGVVCSEMGECLWNSAVMFISTRLLAPCRMFWVFYSTDWIVDLYYQHWKSTWPLLPRSFPARRAIDW